SDLMGKILQTALAYSETIEVNEASLREKLSVAQLQREVARSKSEGTMREKLIHELEEERHLRLESEKRLREVTLESERNRAQMRGLQEQFSRMEETVRNLLQNQGSPDQNGEGTVNIMKVYQEKLLEEDRKCKETMEHIHIAVDEDSRSENSSTEEEKEKTKLLLERLKALEGATEVSGNFLLGGGPGDVFPDHILHGFIRNAPHRRGRECQEVPRCTGHPSK
ncbi:hypothetical protein KIL84_013069, partial [Mauremys mutica]